MQRPTPKLLLATWIVAAAMSGTATAQSQTQGQTQNPAITLPDPSLSTTPGGPIRLRQPGVPAPLAPASAPSAAQLPAEKSRPSEFEAFVQRLAGDVPIRRFGSELMTPAQGDPADTAPLVPPDYLIKPGDELLVTFWGSVDADVRLLVDRAGRVTIPRVGPVLVAGVRYADLPSVIAQRASQVFRNFQLSVSMTQLRSQRVYVTGFVLRPGAYAVSSLSTVAQALLQAGGPTAAGSYRQIELRRGKERVAALDLYDILLRGDRSADVIVQADDVIHVGPVGPQVGVIGSVNGPAVFEIRPGDVLSDVLAMAGGFSAVADRSRVAIERLAERSTVRVVQVELPAGARTALSQGDVLRAFSTIDLATPILGQNKRVRVEGEVLRPGEYLLPPNSSIADALAAAGGMTPAAYPYGTEFTRESVRLTQQQNYDRALRDLETDLARFNSTQRVGTLGEEAGAQAAREAANARLLTTLRAVRPTGRIVLQLEPEGRELPPLALEDGDRLLVPARPTSVGVFGSVFNGGSYLYNAGRRLDDYLALAGGPKRGADERSTFVIRANGSVVSNQQSAGWLGRGALGALRAEPGDTIFVPEELEKTNFVQGAKDWTQILYQFGLGIAGIVAASR